MSSPRPTTTIDTLPDDVFIEIFNLCRTDELFHAPWRHHPWKWQRLAHVCRTWRHIILASPLHLHLGLLCTNGTPVKENLGHLPALPIVISYLRPYFQGGDRDNLIAALEHRDRVRVVGLTVPRSLLYELATAMQEPFPALIHLRLESEKYVIVPPLPDTFLGGSAPRLRTIHIFGISFPAMSTLLSSAHDLIYVHLRNMPLSGYGPPEKMVASLAALPRLKYLTLGFKSGIPYPGRIRLSPTTWTVLPALSRFTFYGPIQYLEDFVAQINTPRLDYLRIARRIEYLGRHGVADFQIQIPQLCKFINRSEKLRFRRAELVLQPRTVIVNLFHRGQSSFRLSIQKQAMGQVINQISAMLSDVDFLSINSDQKGGDNELGDGIRWREVFRPFTALKALSADDKIACHIPFSLNNIARETAAEMLPALELLCLENEPVMFVRKFVATRQSMGRPVTFINKGKEFQERLNMLDVCE